MAKAPAAPAPARPRLTHRPDLALLDDMENNDNVRSPEQRDKLKS